MGKFYHVRVLLSRYGPILEEMYTHIEQRQRERQDVMRRAAPQGTIRDMVREVLFCFRIVLYPERCTITMLLKELPKR